VAQQQGSNGRNSARDLIAQAEREVDRIEREGGPVTDQRARYIAARGLVQSAQAQLAAGGLGWAFLLPVLRLALLALLGTATVAGAVQTVRVVTTTGRAAAGAAPRLVGGLVTLALVGTALFAVAQLGPALAGSVRESRARLAS